MMLSSFLAIAHRGEILGKFKWLLSYSLLHLSYTCQLFSSFCEMLGFSWHHEKTGDELRLFSLPSSNISNLTSINLNLKKKEKKRKDAFHPGLVCSFFILINLHEATK